MMELLEAIGRAKVYDLAQPYFTGMPHYPTHPPFLFGLTKQHGDSVGPAGNSSFTNTRPEVDGPPERLERDAQIDFSLHGCRSVAVGSPCTTAAGNAAAGTAVQRSPKGGT